MEPNKSMMDGGETYQVGCTPLQFFSSPAVPVLPGTPLEPRRGRPSPSPLGQSQAVTPSVGAHQAQGSGTTSLMKNSASTSSVWRRGSR